MDTTTLLDGTSVLEDPDLHEQQAKAGSLAVSGWFKWITFEVLGHAVLATLCTGTSFVVMEYILDVSPNVSLLPHACTGIIIGLLLVARVVVGSQQATAAAGQVISFASGLRTVAMLSCNVSEKLTISAGADLEKKATAKFRYELVRLLNLAFYSYTLMLKGFKLVTPPASLVPLEGGVMEAEVLSVVSCPTAMVCKWITNLFEQQRQAQRITDTQVGVITGELIKLTSCYQATNGLQFTPMPAMLNGFTYFFVVAWVYTITPVVAVMEMHENGKLNNEGFGLSLAFTFFLALFFFGLFEAGKVIEAPLATVVTLIPIDEMGHTLSDDLSNLVDDPDDEVPVFLPRPPQKRELSKF